MVIPSILDNKILDKKEVYLYSVLKYNNKIPQLVGTSSLDSQLYPADIDMLCLVNKSKSYQRVQDTFKSIINKISKIPNLYFIEFKLQNLDKSEKYKFYNSDNVNGDFFKNNYDSKKIDICKIDLLVFNQNYFKEISCIYSFNDFKLIDTDIYIKTLLEDQKDYYKEGNYYKSLKRYMAACKMQEIPNVNIIVNISKLFNGPAGKLYQLNNYIMACNIYINKFGIDDKVQVIFDNLDVKNKEEMDKLSNILYKQYTKAALDFIKMYKIPVGKVEQFQEKLASGTYSAGSWFGDAWDGFKTGFMMPVNLAVKALPLAEALL